MTAEEFLIVAGGCTALLGAILLGLEFFKWSLTHGILGLGGALLASGLVVMFVAAVVSEPPPPPPRRRY